MATKQVTSYVWDEAETLSAQEMERLQVGRLRACVARVSRTVPFYRDKLAEMKVREDSIKTLDDLSRLPLTTKQDLRDHYPFALFAVPLKEVVRLHASSGTTGKPTVVSYTRDDIDLWSSVVARALAMAGVTSEDIVHNAYGYGLFTGGLGIHYGAEKIGAKVIPVSGGNTRRQLMIMQDFGSTVLTCTPSYSLLMAEAAQEEGIDARSLALKVGIFGAEPWSERMRQEIEQRLGIMALDIYGLSEVIGPGVAMECPYKAGMHIAEDHFIPEIIDPDTGERLRDGELGELVFTCVTKEALPLLRFRTRDRTRLTRGKCNCGRTTVRMEKVLGRTDDMLIVRGVNVFPSQIETALLRTGEVEPHYQIVVDRSRHHMDELELSVETSKDVFQDQERLSRLQETLRQEVQSALGISCKVLLVGPKQIERSEGKAVRVVDKRGL